MKFNCPTLFASLLSLASIAGAQVLTPSPVSGPVSVTFTYAAPAIEVVTAPLMPNSTNASLHQSDIWRHHDVNGFLVKTRDAAYFDLNIPAGVDIESISNGLEIFPDSLEVLLQLGDAREIWIWLTVDPGTLGLPGSQIEAKRLLGGHVQSSTWNWSAHKRSGFAPEIRPTHQLTSSYGINALTHVQSHMLSNSPATVFPLLFTISPASLAAFGAAYAPMQSPMQELPSAHSSASIYIIPYAGAPIELYLAYDDMPEVAVTDCIDGLSVDHENDRLVVSFAPGSSVMTPAALIPTTPVGERVFPATLLFLDRALIRNGIPTEFAVFSTPEVLGLMDFDNISGLSIFDPGKLSVTQGNAVREIVPAGTTTVVKQWSLTARPSPTLAVPNPTFEACAPAFRLHIPSGSYDLRISKPTSLPPAGYDTAGQWGFAVIAQFGRQLDAACTMVLGAPLAIHPAAWYLGQGTGFLAFATDAALGAVVTVPNNLVYEDHQVFAGLPTMPGMELCGQTLFFRINTDSTSVKPPLLELASSNFLTITSD